MTVNSLLPQHLALIKDSAISLDVAMTRGYLSVTDPKVLTNLGFARSQALTPGLLIPIFGPSGELSTHQVRPDTPRTDKRKEKPIKYETPAGSQLCIDVNPEILDELRDEEVPLFITEGSRKADAAISQGLCCIGLMGVWGWKNKGGSLPDWDQVPLKGREVSICYDSDVTSKESVRDAMLGLIKFLEGKGAQVKVVSLPDLVGGGKTGLDDYLSLGGTVDKLRDEYTEPSAVWIYRHCPQILRSGPYEMTDSGTFRVTGSGDELKRETLCNFKCLVREDIFRTDGVSETAYRKLLIQKASQTREITVAADQFGLMNWTRQLGTHFIIEAGAGKKDHLRAAIEKISASQGLDTTHDYSSTGWVASNGVNYYVGTARAEQAGVRAALAGPLSRFRIPLAPEGDELKAGILSALSLWDVAPDSITIPLFSAVFRAPVAPAPFAIFLVGSTGVFKTELAALAQRFFGPEMDAQHLPGSWSSTGNALEEQAFLAKETILVVDDFVPAGSMKEVSALQSRAERLLRATGNGSGRGRLNADVSLRVGRAPRGLILSTGEDLPSGQSLRARFISLELSKGDVNTGLLTRAQRDAESGVLAGVMAAYLDYLAPKLTEFRSKIPKLKEKFREEMIGCSHARTPDATAELAIGMLLFQEFAVARGALTDSESEMYSLRAMRALSQSANAQSHQLREANPVDRFAELFRAALVAKRAHICDIDGGPPVGHGLAFGWEGQDRSQGDSMGWVDLEYVYVLPSAALKAVRDLAGPADPFNSTDRALGKQLRQRNLLALTEEARGTNTFRKAFKGTRQAVWVIPRSWLLPTESDQTDQFDHSASNPQSGGQDSGQKGAANLGTHDPWGLPGSDQSEAVSA